MINFIKYIKPQKNLHFLSQISIKRVFSQYKQVPVQVQEHKYFKMIKDLQDKQYVDDLIKDQVKLYGLDEGKYATFKHLQLKINDLLSLWRLITWAQAYHPSISISSLQKTIRKVQKLSSLAFSQSVNHTHENVEKQGSQGSAINFSLYFDLAPKILPEMSQLYLNGYLHIARQYWPLEMVRVRQAIRQQEMQVFEKMIVQKSNHFLSQTLKILKINKKDKISQYHMSLYLSHFKNQLDQLQQKDKQLVRQHIWKYLLQDANQNSFLHLQNIIYCLFLGINNLQMTESIYQWLSFKFKNQNTNASTIYLSNIYSHQDKLSCLKIDLWLAILKHSVMKSDEKRNQRLQTVAQSIVDQLKTTNFNTWKFKYQVWMFDSVVTYLDSDIQTVSSLVKAITKKQLASNHSLFTFISSFITFATSKQLNAAMLELQQSISSWLYNQPKSSLLSQPSLTLCQIFPHADRHPALHPLYKPYLQKLLDLSLGQFKWTTLNKLYYFGLRWKCNKTDQGYWRMQYVRRYIMTQYAEMGILRRQIPEDSYFYKIHQQTTPQEFYRNFLESQ